MRVQYTSPSAFVCLTFSTIRSFKMSKAKTNKKHTTIALKFNSGLSLERKEKQQFEEARRENFGVLAKFYFLFWVMVTCVFTLWCFSYWAICLYIMCFLVSCFNQNLSLNMKRSRQTTTRQQRGIYLTRLESLTLHNVEYSLQYGLSARERTSQKLEFLILWKVVRGEMGNRTPVWIRIWSIEDGE